MKLFDFIHGNPSRAAASAFAAVVFVGCNGLFLLAVGAYPDVVGRWDSLQSIARLTAAVLSTGIRFREW